MTSASEYSRMSTLSDFPVPPAQPDSILQISDAASTPQLQQPKDLEIDYSPRSGSRRRTTFGASDDMDHYSGSRVRSLDSRRTTFGASDDVDHYTGAQV